MSVQAGMNILLTLIAVSGTPADLPAAPQAVAPARATVESSDPVNEISFPDDFQTVLSLVKATGLDQALVGLEGEFTLFAPNDAAFAKLPAELMAELGKPENVDTLKSILLYHVVPARVPASAAVKATSAPTVEGTELTVALKGEALYVDQAQVIATDLEFAGGIVHAVDAVLVPADVAAALAAPAPPIAGCATVFSLVELAGLSDAVAGMDAFTLFAPTDEAFAALPAETVELLLAPENRENLQKVLLYHVVGAKVMSPAAIDLAKQGGETGTPVQTLDGKVMLKATAAGLNIGGANIVRVDEEFANGIVHVIDAVMIPADLKLNPINPNRVKLQGWMDEGVAKWEAEDWNGAAQIWRAALTWGVEGDRIADAGARKAAQQALKTAAGQSGKEAAWTLNQGLEQALGSF